MIARFCAGELPVAVNEHAAMQQRINLLHHRQPDAQHYEARAVWLRRAGSSIVPRTGHRRVHTHCNSRGSGYEKIHQAYTLEFIPQPRSALQIRRDGSTSREGPRTYQASPQAPRDLCCTSMGTWGMNEGSRDRIKSAVSRGADRLFHHLRTTCSSWRWCRFPRASFLSSLALVDDSIRPLTRAALRT
jgi:hypothetical protein